LFDFVDRDNESSKAKERNKLHICWGGVARMKHHLS